jgi:hypothetical protein
MLSMMIFWLRDGLLFGKVHDLIYLGLSAWPVGGSTLLCNPHPMQLRNLETARLERHSVRPCAATPRKHPDWRCKRFGVIATASKNGNQDDPATANANQQSWKGTVRSSVEQGPNPPQASSTEQSSCPREVATHGGMTQNPHIFLTIPTTIIHSFQVHTMPCQLGQAPKPLQGSQRQCPQSRLTRTSSTQVCTCCAAADCSSSCFAPCANTDPC